jgi:pimeloyl-ACP methyl ester carboxylesterase
MPFHEIGPEDAIYYEHVAPASEDGCTFVFFNALTGDTTAWEAVIGPELRARGHGTLAYDMRGQGKSRFSPGIVLDVDLIVDDAFHLLSGVKPTRPIFVGLSIGGLFAVRAWLEGADAVGLVLVNTLRQDGARLRWIGDALVRAIDVGGLELFRDLFLPLLVNEAWLEKNRAGFLQSPPEYRPLNRKSGAYKLLSEASRTADWNLPYEALSLPTLVVTGLQDHVFLERDVVENLFNRLPRGRRVDMPEAGHLVPAERPELLAQILLDFVKEV